MGVRRLMTYCLAHKDSCGDKQDLVQLAKKQGRVEILVDFLAFLAYVIEKIQHGLTEVSGNTSIHVIGAEYGAINEYITKFVTMLKDVGVHLVFFVDGSRDSTVNKEKVSTWKKRHSNDIEKVEFVMQVCARQRFDSLHSESKNKSPFLMKAQALKTLTRCNCEMIHCVSGEADPIIAAELRKRQPTAVAVFSNDSDFFIFKDCRLITYSLFDIDHDIQIYDEKPLKKLIVSVISSQKVVQMMKLQDRSKLVDLSIICGNDFTGPLFNDRALVSSLPFDYNMQVVVDWLRRNTLEKHAGFRKAMCREDFSTAVNTSRTFYSADPVAVSPKSDASLHNSLVEGVKHHGYPANVVAMHSGFYWRRVVLEKTGVGQPCSEVAFTPIRQEIYRMVLPHGEGRRVEEWGRTQQEALRKDMVFQMLWELCQDSGILCARLGLSCHTPCCHPRIRTTTHDTRVRDSATTARQHSSTHLLSGKTVEDGFKADAAITSQVATAIRTSALKRIPDLLSLFRERG